MDELEHVLRTHGRLLADTDRDLRDEFESESWPARIRAAIGPELLRRASDVPFFAELIRAARRVPEEACRAPADGPFRAWSDGERERSRPQHDVAEMAGEPPEGKPPARLVTAERALLDRTRSIAVVLDSLVNPRNAGAVARSAEYHGLQELHLIQPEGRTAFQRSLTRACDRYLDVHWYRDAATALRRLREGGYAVLVADWTPGARPIAEVELADRIAVVLGSEQLGVSVAMREAADGTFFIPGCGFSSFLNVSTAAAIAIHELDRRMRIEGRRSPLAPDDLARLRRAWYVTLAGGAGERAARYLRWAERPPVVDDGERPAPAPGTAVRTRKQL